MSPPSALGFKTADEGLGWKVEDRARCRAAACDRVRCRLAAAREDARSSAEGASPKMKNLMKEKRMRPRTSWPIMKPDAKDPEDAWPF